MIALRSDLATSRDMSEGSGTRTIDNVAKLSLSLPDDLMDDVRRFADGDVRSFATAAIKEAVNQRKEQARQHLDNLVQELEAQVGPVDEDRVARFTAILEKTASAAEPAEMDEGEDS